MDKIYLLCARYREDGDIHVICAVQSLKKATRLNEMLKISDKPTTKRWIKEIQLYPTLFIDDEEEE